MVATAHSLHMHEANRQPRTRVTPQCLHGPRLPPSSFPPTKAPHILLTATALPLTHRHTCVHRLAQAHVPTFRSSCMQAYTHIPDVLTSLACPRAHACPRPQLTSAGAALARDGLPADPTCLHLLEARHLEGVCWRGLQVLGLGGTWDFVSGNKVTPRPRHSILTCLFPLSSGSSSTHVPPTPSPMAVSSAAAVQGMGYRIRGPGKGWGGMGWEIGGTGEGEDAGKKGLHPFK